MNFLEISFKKIIFQLKTDCVFLDLPLKPANLSIFRIFSWCYSQKLIIWKKLVFQKVAPLLLDPASVVPCFNVWFDSIFVEETHWKMDRKTFLIFHFLQVCLNCHPFGQNHQLISLGAKHWHSSKNIFDCFTSFKLTK